MTQKCIIDSRKKDGCDSCTANCPHRIALHGFTGEAGRVGAAGVPLTMQMTTLDNSIVRRSQPRLYATLDKYVKTFERPFTGDKERIKSFYFWSEEPGTGKSTTAAALVNEYIATHYVGSLLNGKTPQLKPAMFLSLTNIQSEYTMAVMADEKETIKAVQDTFKEAARTPYLVIDDLGVKTPTDSFMALVYNLLDKRTSGGLPTIYTANFPLDEIKTKYDKRIYDRMRDMCAERHFEGESKRGMRRSEDGR